MKKFLIGVICIIPIVVVLALSVTSDIILLTTPVNPSDMQLRNSNNEIIGDNDVLKVDIGDTGEFIIVDIFPTMTPDKSITYEREDDYGQGIVELEKMESSDNRYELKPVRAGVTQVIIRAKANVNVYRVLTIQVTSDSVETTAIYDSNGVAVTGEYALTAQERFFMDVYPVDAMNASGVIWRSSDSKIAKVDANGNVTPVGEGKAGIEAVVRDKAGETHSAMIIVDTSGAVAGASVTYTAENVTLSWVREHVAINPDATEVEYISGDKYLLKRTDNGAEAEVSVVRCEAGEIVILNPPEVLYTGNGPAHLVTAVVEEPETGDEDEDDEKDDADDEALEPVFSSETPDVASVTENGVISLLKPGRALLRVTYGDSFKQVEITVRERPATFNLDLQTADARLGIQMTRVWGYYWLTESGELTSSFDFGIAGDKNTFDVNWSVSKGADGEELASIARRNDGTQGITVTFLESAVGRSVTVTAVLVVDNREINSVKRSFTFNVNPKKETVNVYNFAQMAMVLSRDAKWGGGERFSCYDVVMQQNIYAEHVVDNIRGGVYGNGFLYDGAGVPESEEVRRQLGFQGGLLRFNYGNVWQEIKAFNESHADVYAANAAAGIPFTQFTLDFVDISMRCAATLDEADGRNAVLYIEMLWGEIEPDKKDIPRDPPVNLKFLQVYNADKGVELGYISDLLVEGCIFGDNARHGILAYYYGVDHRKFGADGSNVTLRNNVFKMHGAPAVVFASPAYKESFDMNCAPNLTIEGVCDIYNWKTRDEFSDMLSLFILKYLVELAANESDGAGQGLIDMFRDSFANIINEVVSDETLDSLFYSYGGKEYTSLGIMGLGAPLTWDPATVTVKSDDVSALVLPFRDAEGNTIGALRGIESAVKLIYPKISSVSKPSYLIANDFSRGEPEIKPGDPVPNSKELYAKLTGQA